MPRPGLWFALAGFVLCSCIHNQTEHTEPEARSEPREAVSARSDRVEAGEPRKAVNARSDGVEAGEPREAVKARSDHVEAEVARYLPNAMEDLYEDGSFASYDATELKLAGPQHQGGTLVIYHSTPPAEASPWRHPGTKLKFWLDHSDRTGSTLFTGALRDVEFVQPAN